VNDVLAVLQEFHRAALGRLLRHQAGARLIRQYDVNNTYQFIINRDETHLSWLGSAIAELGGTSDITAETMDRAASGRNADAARRVLDEDAHEAQAFVDAWRPRVAVLPNARHARMLNVILGEVLEQRRFFLQALEGRTDLLGRRGEQVGPAMGDVLPERWIE
jgi:hypothetical protein